MARSAILAASVAFAAKATAQDTLRAAIAVAAAATHLARMTEAAEQAYGARGHQSRH
jgi:hypothetical protein